MPHSNTAQTSFLGGEWSPHALGRFEDPRYAQALTTCQNAFPMETGAWTRRTGFLHCGYTNRGFYPKFFPFQFSDEAPYDVELTVNGTTTAYLRVWRDSSLVTDSTLTLDNSNVPAGTPATFTTTATLASVSWATGDDVYFTPTTTSNSRNCAGIINRVFTITGTGAKTFTMVDAITGTAVNAADFTYDNTVTNTVSRVYKVSSTTFVKTAAECAAVLPIFVPAVDTGGGSANLWLCHPSYPPLILKQVTWPTFPAFATFTTRSWPLLLDGPWWVEGAIKNDGTTVSAATGSGVTFTSPGAPAGLNGGAGFVAADIGRSIRILSEPTPWASGTTYSSSGGDVVTRGTYPNSTYWISLPDSSNVGKTPELNVESWAPYAGGAQWTWALITARADTSHVTVTIEGPDITYSTNIVWWLPDRFNWFLLYPAGGVVHEGRLWLFGDNFNDRFEAGVANTYDTFSPTNPDGSVSDDRGFSYYLGEQPPTAMTWMTSDINGLLVGTQASIYTITGSPTTDPISPTNISAKPIPGGIGSNRILPVRMGSTLVFFDGSQRQLWEVVADAFSGRFQPRLLTTFAGHLTAASGNRLEGIAGYTPNLWIPKADGTLAGLVYRRHGFMVTQPPDIWGWHKHTHGRSGTTFIDCSTYRANTVTANNYALQTLRVATYDGSKYHSELLMPEWDASLAQQYSTIGTAKYGWFLDQAPALTVGRDPALDSGSAGIKFYGLGYAEGLTVTAFIDGLSCGTYTVSSGTITVPYGSDADGLLTTARLVSSSSSTNYNFSTIIDVKNSGSRAQVQVPVVIGFPYTSVGQRPRQLSANMIKVPTGDGLGLTRRTHMASALLADCGSGVKFGTSSGNARTATLRDETTGAALTNPNSSLFNGVWWGTLDDPYGFGSGLYWSISTPYPLVVCAVEQFMNTEPR